MKKKWKNRCKEQSVDLAGWLTYVLVIVAVVFTWFYAGIAGDNYIEDTTSPADAIVYEVVESGALLLTGIREDYLEQTIEIPTEIDGQWVYRIDSNFLEDSNVKHVLMDELPNSVADDAFSSDVIIYADNSKIIMERWAQHVEVQPEAVYAELIKELKVPQVDIKANLWDLWKNGFYVIGMAIVLYVGFRLLGKLRENNGFANPYVFQINIGHKDMYGRFYYTAVVLANLVAFLGIFGITFDYYADYFQTMAKVNHYVQMIGIPIVAVLLLVVFIREACQSSAVWLMARWYVRLIQTTLYVGVGAGLGWLVGFLGNETITVRAAIGIITVTICTIPVVMVVYPILKLFGVPQASLAMDRRMNSVPKSAPRNEFASEKKAESWRTTSVRTEDGIVTIRDYGYGRYVGDDEIVGEDATSVTCASGKVYTKQ